MLENEIPESPLSRVNSSSRRDSLINIFAEVETMQESINKKMGKTEALKIEVILSKHLLKKRNQPTIANQEQNERCLFLAPTFSGLLGCLVIHFCLVGPFSFHFFIVAGHHVQHASKK